jgi:transcriptional regulator with XRE-family HTH domain
MAIVNHDKKYLAQRRQALGKRLRELREAKGLSQQALGELVDIPVVTINKIELGRWDFPISYLTLFGDALDFDFLPGITPIED